MQKDRNHFISLASFFEEVINIKLDFNQHPELVELRKKILYQYPDLVELQTKIKQL